MFVVEAWVNDHDRDRDNYPRCEEINRETLEAETIDFLYEDMAAFKIAHDRGSTDQYEYRRAEFGAIYEFTSSQGVDTDRIEQTECYQKHLRGLEQQAAAELMRKKSEEEKRNLALAEKERAEFLRLQLKYGKN